MSKLFTDRQGNDCLIERQTLQYEIAAETILWNLKVCFEGPGPPEGTNDSRHAFVVRKPVNLCWIGAGL